MSMSGRRGVVVGFGPFRSSSGSGSEARPSGSADGRMDGGGDGRGIDGGGEDGRGTAGVDGRGGRGGSAIGPSMIPDSARRGRVEPQFSLQSPTGNVYVWTPATCFGASASWTVTVVTPGVRVSIVKYPLFDSLPKPSKSRKIRPVVAP